MASNFGMKTWAVLALAVGLCVQGTLGEITCEKLDQDACAFAVSASGKRCVLEKRFKRSGVEAFTCKTSEIQAEKIKNHVETEQCIKACGLDKKSLGISSDSLLEKGFTKKLCSSQCYENCPNVIELFYNLAAGEGVFLPKLCEAQGAKVKSEAFAIQSSGFVAQRPPKAKLISDPAAGPAQAKLLSDSDHVLHHAHHAHHPHHPHHVPAPAPL